MSAISHPATSTRHPDDRRAGAVHPAAATERLAAAGPSGPATAAALR